MSNAQRERLKTALGQPKVAASATRSIGQIRDDFARFMNTMPVAPGVKVSEAQLGYHRALRVEAQHHTRPGTILYFHGGGFIMGSPETALSLTTSLVAKTGIQALSLDYRLSPEYPFPAAIDDCADAYQALLDSGIEPHSIVFAGDSAGGGLCVTACLRARDRGLPLPGGIVTFSAGLDATRTGNSVESKNGIDPFFSRENLHASSDMYLGGADPHQALLSPAVYANLAGFPAMLLQVGTNELLLDDSTRLAERARAADVDVILDITANVPHVFQAFIGVLDEADDALDRAALFIRQRLAR
ncbi:alpha/beta hydrolase [Shimwellia pseudoproteus]|uniref:alpha/beta hydrolase n=1 Tax=Shimwellia pseudoproteus TaxID=570012 RepID=UPI0018EDE858|nr:alpha/beta hydrolase [Shimwellia pseudoproteus]MBJ3814923.1 alpha/beta hydrolase [Shimwellia pseudoproteus]